MGIYRTLLEEEVPHLDDNNNPDDQIKELQDVIEDQDANQAEQDAAQDAAYGPDCGVDDIMDESAMAIFEFEAGHAQIMQAIGMHELQEASMGREFIMEAADIKGFFKSVKDKVVAFFKKVWSVLQRWAGNLTAVFTSNKKFYSKYSAQIKAGFAKKDSGDSKKPKGYEFNIGEINKEAADTSKYLEGFASVSDISKAIESKGTVDNAMTAEDVEEAMNKVRGALSTGGSVAAGEFSKELKKSLYGDTEPKAMWMSVEAVEAGLADKKNLKDSTKKFMTEAKKQMKTTLNKLSTLEKSASKYEDATDRNKMMAICTRYSTFVRSVLTATQTWRSARLGAINAFARQARRYGMIYVAAANKEKHKGFQKESAEFGFLGAMGLV